MVWKTVNIGNTGTSIKFGANDMDKVSNAFSGVDVDDFDIAGDFKVRSSKFQLADSDNSHKYVFVPGNLTGDRNALLPALTAADTVMFNDFPATIKNKTLDSSCDITAAVLGSGHYTYLLYNDAGTYKARNGITGVVSYSGTDVGAVLKSVFDSVSTTTPLYIHVAPGDFTIKSWDFASFKHSNVTMKGAGSGLTQFIVHNDVTDIAGHTRVFAFEGAPTAFTSLTIASDTPVDSFAVLTNSTTDLVAGCHVMIGSEAALPGSAKAGEHNRVVAIVATGGSPSQRIILEKATRYAYNTADTPWIRRIDFLENNHFEGFTIKSNQDLDSQIAFMRLDFNYDCHVRDVQFKDWGAWNTGGFHHCLVNNIVVNSSFTDMLFEQSPERGDSTGENAVGYAISCRSGCESVWYENVRFTGLIRHCFTTTANTEAVKNGQPRNIWLVNCNSETTDEASFDTHAEGKGIHFVNCTVNSARSGGGSTTAQGTEDTDGFNCRSSDTEFVNCKVMNNRGNGFSCDGGLTGIRFDGCTVKTLTLGSRTGIAVGAAGTTVTNCLIDGVSGIGINIDADDCIITNNKVINSTSAGIDVNNADNLIITGNRLESNGTYGINFSAGDCQNNIITGNQFDSNVTAAVLNGDQVGNVEVNNVGYGSSAAKIASTSGAAVDWNTTAAEQDMLNYSVPANALGANGCVRFTITGYLLQNGAASTVYTFKIKFGSTVLYQGVSASLVQSATKLPYRIQGEIGNNNSTAAQSFSGHIEVNDTTTGNATGLGVITDDEQAIMATFSSEGADTTKDTTAAVTLQVTVTMANSDAATHTVIKRKIVEVMKSS